MLQDTDCRRLTRLIQPHRVDAARVLALALLCCTLLGEPAYAERLSRVCRSGEPAGTGACPATPQPGNKPTDWACTQDAATGLIWELKPVSGLQARDKTFTHYSDAYNPSRELGGPLDASGYMREVNQAAPCARRDWRLPSRLELIGLLRPSPGPAHGVNAGPKTAAIDSAYFPDLADKKRVFWSASPFAGKPSNAWGVDFNDGLSGDDNRSIYYAVRLVAGPPAKRELSPSADGAELLDRAAGLAWRRCAEGAQWHAGACDGAPARYNFEQAERRAREQADAAGAGWRLPSMQELASLVDDSRVEPAIDVTLFPGTPAQSFWASTPSPEHAAYRWSVHFGTGHAGHHAHRDDRFALRLVRDVK